jgi:hypothetical protein
MARPVMLPHHEAWLLAHPDRTAEWLRRMLAEGFDVHHLDGNHNNNDPGNLLLIETQDHNEILHGTKWVRRFGLRRPVYTPPADLAARDKGIYEAYVSHGNLSEIVRTFGVSRSRIGVLARKYAVLNGLPWAPLTRKRKRPIPERPMTMAEIRRRLDLKPKDTL